ncbi:MAG: glycerol-3-phosphate dehydrogenase C-terminal domain-containing protein, partial [Curvibacter sp.]
EGRGLCAVPWQGKLLLGPTDTPCRDLLREPRPLRAELEFILGEAGRYLSRAPGPADVLSLWVGLRPLVRPVGDEADTGSISREHTVLQAASGLVTVTGGKWTTYRAMAEDVLSRCVRSGLLPERGAGVSDSLHLVGAPEGDEPAGPGMTAAPGAHLYGAEIPALHNLPGAGDEFAPGLTAAMVRFAARYEYALTVEDVLARRSRLLFLDAALAADLAPAVARILEQETGRDPALAAFLVLAQDYLRWPSSQGV